MEDTTAYYEYDGNETSTSIYNIAINTTPIPMDLGRMYCGKGWDSFKIAYGNVHGYVSLVVCFFGSLANLLNLIVLTRKAMLSPTNAILTGLALADLLNMVEYIPFALYRIYWRNNYSYGMSLFILVHSNFSQVCHTIAIWLTLTLAIWRYISVGFPQRSKTLCTMIRAKMAIFSAYIVCPLLCFPVYFTFSIAEKQPSKFYVLESRMARAYGALLLTINYWIYSVVIKLIPCIILTVVSFRLINALIEAKRRKAMLVSKRTVNAKGQTENSSDSSSDRTTKMLLAVLLLFLITEFPQGILGLLSLDLILGKKFFYECYTPLGDLIDIVTLFNSAINFILYCVMSKKFRETFCQIFYIDAAQVRIQARIALIFPGRRGQNHDHHTENNTLSTNV